MTDFVIQYELEIDDRLYLVVRYDTAHGFPHRDMLNPDGSTKHKTEIPLPVDQAFQRGYRDIQQNWERYRRDFEREVRHYGRKGAPEYPASDRPDL